MLLLLRRSEENMQQTLILNKFAHHTKRTATLWPSRGNHSASPKVTELQFVGEPTYYDCTCDFIFWVAENMHDKNVLQTGFS